MISANIYSREQSFNLLPLHFTFLHHHRTTCARRRRVCNNNNPLSAYGFAGSLFSCMYYYHAAALL